MNLYLFGCGGHGKVILDILLRQGRSVTAFVDDAPPAAMSEIHGVPIYSSACLPTLDRDRSRWIVAIGHNRQRQRVAAKLTYLGFQFTTAVHPSAQIGMGVKLAPGTVVMANGVINADTKVGQHVILNTGATIDHDCVIGDYCHIAPGCSVCGQVQLDDHVFLGVGSRIAPNLSIGENTVCGAGAVVLRSLPAGILAYGCPAHIMCSLDSGEMS